MGYEQKLDVCTTLHISQSLKNKIDKIAKDERRSLRQLYPMLLDAAVREYQKGKIKL